MYHIAIVEDETEFSNQLQEYLLKYQQENQCQLKINVFHDGAEILAGYQSLYDIILMDIEMPRVNGMDAAEKIRKIDRDVVIMFITNMAGYAIRGYSVGALDFVMKPISYYQFAMKMTRAIARVKSRQQEEILLTLPDGVKKVGVSQIYYIEVQNRMLYYYTEEGVYQVKGTMAGVEKAMASYPFVKCNHWYMVNLMHVSQVRKNIAIVEGNELEISRRNKTAFLRALTDYMGGTS